MAAGIVAGGATFEGSVIGSGRTFKILNCLKMPFSGKSRTLLVVITAGENHQSKNDYTGKKICLHRCLYN
jgi:hypothetical protein